METIDFIVLEKMNLTLKYLDVQKNKPQNQLLEKFHISLI